MSGSFGPSYCPMIHHAPAAPRSPASQGLRDVRNSYAAECGRKSTCCAVTLHLQRAFCCQGATSAQPGYPFWICCLSLGRQSSASIDASFRQYGLG